jgi:hypothetical protein
MLLFGLDTRQLTLELPTSSTQKTCYCTEFSECWKFGKVAVGTVEPQSINYCCKYLQKEDTRVTGSCQIKTFCHASKGIGLRWALDNKDFLLNSLSVTRNNHPLGEKLGLPRYYAQKIGVDPMRLRSQANADYEDIKKQNNYIYTKEEYDLIKAKKKLADLKAMENIYRGRKIK